jgi:hypothetical protein
MPDTILGRRRMQSHEELSYAIGWRIFSVVHMGVLSCLSWTAVGFQYINGLQHCRFVKKQGIKEKFDISMRMYVQLKRHHT